jgi:ATP-binding cassette subfamily C protein
MEYLPAVALTFAAAAIVITMADISRTSRQNARMASTLTGKRQKMDGAPLRDALFENKRAFIGVALFSGIINVLMLTGSIFMLEVYDRILPSRSLPTLVVLSILAAGLYVAQGAFDLFRWRILTRIGAALSERLFRRVFTTMVALPLKITVDSDGLQPMRDLDAIRSFLSGLGPTALFDLPWMPLYVAIIYAFHPILGYAAIAGCIVLVALTLLMEALTKHPTKEVASLASSRHRLGEAGVRNAEVLAAMGLAERLGDQWQQASSFYTAQQQRISDLTSGIGAISKVVRMTLQSGMLAIGAFLVIENEASAGVIIAASILTSRALAPVELAIAHWKGFVAARQSWHRLEKLFTLLPDSKDVLPLPAPVSTFAVDSISVAPPGQQKLIIQNISFALKAGQGLGIIGPSASGKSTLVRAIVGVWEPVRGKVSLDGAAIGQWAPATLGRHIGYLPQDVELLSGTIAQNIARFDPEADPEAIVAAAKAAGVHDLIVGLRSGYDTEVGIQGAVLSAGQRQRIALARALYEEPFVVVLDEPNSNLDAEGEAALTRAIHGIRERGGIAIVVAHRPSALVALDTVVAVANGQIYAIGPRDDVLGKVLHAPSPHPPLKVVSEAAS